MIVRYWCTLLFSVLLAVFANGAEQKQPVCTKEIPQDICPQREGYDRDCERRCAMEYPMRIASGCQLRNTGTLLSFFGIRSFVCVCHVPALFCQAAQQAFKTSLSILGLTQHSRLEKITDQVSCPSPASLSCNNAFSARDCAWKRSIGADWFVGEATGPMPYRFDEAPVGRYLAGVGRVGQPTLSLDTCGRLCSQGEVNITARIWRAPWVGVELCFRESDSPLCAPVAAANGRWISEVIPQTNDFGVSLKFTNISDGDVVMLDDFSVSFQPCPVTTSPHAPPTQATPRPRIEHTATHSIEGEIIGDQKPLPSQPRILSRMPTPLSPSSRIVDSSPAHAGPAHAGPAHQPTAPIQRPRLVLPRNKGRILHSSDSSRQMDAKRRRFCADGECTLLHSPSTPVNNPNNDADKSGTSPDRTCIGKGGLLACQAKCQTRDDDGSFARCLRQREYPFQRRCVCRMRRKQARKSSEVSHIASTARATMPPPASVELDGDTDSMEQPASVSLPALPPPRAARPPESADEELVAKMVEKIRKEKEQAMQQARRSKELREREQTSAEKEEEKVMEKEQNKSMEEKDKSLEKEEKVEKSQETNSVVEEEEKETTTVQTLWPVTEDKETPLCVDGSTEACDAHCRHNDTNSSGQCVSSPSSRIPMCRCATCKRALCDFEKNNECGWTDLRTLSSHFNNISIAAKIDIENRYGISRMAPRSYSGLLRRGPVDGPVSLSVDIYPSDSLDVRICVDSLHRCQTQTVSPRAWNRVSAKIKVARAEKLFLLFFNQATDEKTIALDNIEMRAGDCVLADHLRL